MSLLTAHQQAVADRVLDEESDRRTHVVIALSGAHAYGFPSPDSDLDLKAVHVAPTSALVGLRTPSQSAERLEVIDGVEIDYSSNEIGMALGAILKGNGNFLERVLGRCTVRTSSDHESLIPLVRATISKRVFRHYIGFATSQRREAEATRTAKRVLYVLRTALTGVHALRTGEIVADLTQLYDEYGFPEARELIERKRAGERVALDAGEFERCGALLDRAFAAIVEAHRASPLPDEPRGEGELEAWLIELRRRNF